jgi:hypothetical protein
LESEVQRLKDEDDQGRRIDELIEMNRNLEKEIRILEAQMKELAARQREQARKHRSF